MTFLDPESDNGVLFITFSGYKMELQDMPSSIIYKRRNKKWFNFFYSGFRNLWNSENTNIVNFNESWEDNLKRLQCH